MRRAAVYLSDLWERVYGYRVKAHCDRLSNSLVVNGFSYYGGFMKSESNRSSNSNPRKKSFLKKLTAAAICGCGIVLTMAFSAVSVYPQSVVPAVSRIASSDDTRYRIGPGDVLMITVRKVPELTGQVRVDQRGLIRIPMVDGEVRAACLTESELASQITTLYLEYKKSPNVDVFVTEFQSRPVAIIGAVNSPGQFRMQRQVRLLELLTFAGGPAPRAGRIINVIHTGEGNICKSGPPDINPTLAQELSTYKLTDTTKGIDTANPFVQPGDIISLPEADQVFIIGHVMVPQAIALKDKPITLSRAIAMTGGPTRDSKTSRIRIIRQLGDTGKKEEFFVDLQAVLKQKAEDIPLLPNDIVEVPSSAGKTILSALTGAIAPALTQVPVRMIP